MDTNRIFSKIIIFAALIVYFALVVIVFVLLSSLFLWLLVIAAIALGFIYLRVYFMKRKLKSEQDIYLDSEVSKTNANSEQGHGRIIDGDD